MLAGLSSSLTSQVASHGAYAVFVLMLIDAVFPAASELVMLYAGAVAAGVFSSAHHVSLFGAKLGFGVTAFVVMALAGTIGYLVGSLIGWAIGYYGGRPLLERRGLLGRITPVIRSFVSIPAGVFRVPLGPYIVLTAIGSAIWAFAIAGAGYGLGSSYERFHHDFRYAEYAVGAGVLLLAAYLVYRLTKAGTVRRRDDPAR